MKKYLVLFVIASLALVLYLRNREASLNTALPPVTEPGPGLPPGVALPADAGKIEPVTPEQIAASQSQPPPMVMPPAPNLLVFSPADACVKETKVKDVLANHDKTWGYMAKDKLKSYAVLQSVGEQGIKDLSALVGKYQACVSLAREKDLCGSLPKVDGKVDYEMKRNCVETLYPVGFAGYTMGKAGSLYCSGYYRNNLKGASDFITESNFCGIAKEGLPALADKFCGRAPAGVRADCLGTFPRDASGCRNEVCSLTWSVRIAVENNTPAVLGPDLGPLAVVLLDKKEDSCRPLGDMVVQQYCSMKYSIDAKVLQLEVSKNQDVLNKQMRAGRETKSED